MAVSPGAFTNHTLVVHPHTAAADRLRVSGYDGYLALTRDGNSSTACGDDDDDLT